MRLNKATHGQSQQHRNRAEKKRVSENKTIHQNKLKQNGKIFAIYYTNKNTYKLKSVGIIFIYTYFQTISSNVVLTILEFQKISTGTKN